jgi:hypothetical protein
LTAPQKEALEAKWLREAATESTGESSTTE